MLYFNFIDNSEGIDYSERQDVVSSTELISKQVLHVAFITILQETLNTRKMSATVAFIVSSTKTKIKT